METVYQTHELKLLPAGANHQSSSSSFESKQARRSWYSPYQMLQISFLHPCQLRKLPFCLVLGQKMTKNVSWKLAQVIHPCTWYTFAHFLQMRALVAAGCLIIACWQQCGWWCLLLAIFVTMSMFDWSRVMHGDLNWHEETRTSFSHSQGHYSTVAW